MTRYYFIEHRTRGIFKEWNEDAYIDRGEFKPRFTMSANRSERDMFHAFYHYADALVAWEKMPPKIRLECAIMQSPPQRRVTQREWSMMTPPQRNASVEYSVILPYGSEPKGESNG